MKKSIAYLLFFAVLAIASRFFAPWPNFTAMIAVTFAGGMLFDKKATSLLFPLLIVFVSDFVLNNTIYSQGGITWITSGALWIYGSYILIALLGSISAHNSKLKSLLVGGLVSSVLFYLLTNLGVWRSGILYSPDITGLWTSYTAGLPFLMNQVLATAGYAVIIYGFHVLVERNYTESKAVSVGR